MKDPTKKLIKEYAETFTALGKFDRAIKDRPKLYVLRKYVVAINATDAIRLDETTSVHEVEMEAEWRSLNLDEAMGLPTPE